MAEFHLHGGCAAGQAQQLVAQADAEHRHVCFQDGPDRRDGVIAGLGVARPVGQEYAVRFQRQHLGCRGLGGHHRQAAPPVHQHPQNIALDAEIVGHHVPGQCVCGPGTVADTEHPAALVPVVGFVYRHLFRQVHTLEAGKAPGLRQGALLIDDPRPPSGSHSGRPYPAKYGSGGGYRYRRSRRCRAARGIPAGPAHCGNCWPAAAGP